MEDPSLKMEVENVPEIKDDSSLKSEQPKLIEATPIVASVKIEEIALSHAMSQPTTDNRQPTTEPKVSSLSLSSIKAKKELLEAQKGIVKDVVHLPTESFTETEMQEFWFKFADKLGDKGFKIMESLVRINDPVLENTTIIHELPNEGSKIDFEKEKHELLSYLRSHLHNHEITIEIRINESIDTKKAFTTQDKYNRLNEINPNLGVLKKMFDLDL